MFLRNPDNCDFTSKGCPTPVYVTIEVQCSLNIDTPFVALTWSIGTAARSNSIHGKSYDRLANTPYTILVWERQIFIECAHTKWVGLVKIDNRRHLHTDTGKRY